jgi:hypothetical protein
VSKIKCVFCGYQLDVGPVRLVLDMIMFFVGIAWLMRVVLIGAYLCLSEEVSQGLASWPSPLFFFPSYFSMKLSSAVCVSFVSCGMHQES